MTLVRSGACIVNPHGYVRGRAWGYSILRGDAEWILVGVVKEYQPLQDVPFVQKTHSTEPRVISRLLRRLIRYLFCIRPLPRYHGGDGRGQLTCA